MFRIIIIIIIIIIFIIIIIIPPSVGLQTGQFDSNSTRITRQVTDAHSRYGQLLAFMSLTLWFSKEILNRVVLMDP
jgi:amino acid transporter